MTDSASVPHSDRQPIRLDPAEEARISQLEFHAALSELESVVELLEGAELPLEKALASFERGVALSRHCEAKLNAAEGRIQQLLDDGSVADLDTSVLSTGDGT